MRRNSLARLAAFASLAAALAILAPRAALSGDDAPEPDRKAAPPALARVAVPTSPRDGVVGTRIADHAFESLDGGAVRLSDFADRSAIVVVLRDAACPVCRKATPDLAALETAWAPRGAAFLFVNVEPTNDAESVRADAARFAGPMLRDPERRFAAALGARTTAEVFLLDAARTLRYRGASDDRLGLGTVRTEPRHRWLADALEAVLADAPVAVAATLAPGCALPTADGPRRAAVADGAAPTWHDRVSRIVQQRCGACHRAGGAAPFALDAYEPVRSRRRMIRGVVADGIMPPWSAGPGSLPMLNDLSLADDERRDLLAWIDADCPEGDPADAPVPMRRAEGWRIGDPDAIIATPGTMAVPARGVLDYRYVWVKTDFPEDRWVARMELRPRRPEVVHHVLVFLEEPRREGESDGDYRRRWQGGLGGYFAGLVPGQTETVYPPGMAKRLPAGAWLKFQVHHTPNGTAVEDQVELGLVFAEGPPEIEVRTSAVKETEFAIPPGADAHEIVASTQFRAPATILSFAPHMHWRGRAFRYELEHLDGRVETLLDVPRYDFDWQLRYRLLVPLEVPRGARLRARAVYDNSAANPLNPDPTRTVRFGEQTTDEMMIGYFEWYRADEAP